MPRAAGLNRYGSTDDGHSIAVRTSVWVSGLSSLLWFVAVEVELTSY